ncbi:MAG: AraC family transcriptional regulator [Albidovulum sp.]
MDILDDILDTLGLRGALYFRTDFSAPWAVTVPEFGAAARFHLVMQGQLNVTTACGTELTMGPGDLVMIPRGWSHVLADAPGRAAQLLDNVLKETGYDGQGVLRIGTGDDSASTQLLCGHFTFRDRADHPILRALPDHILITAAMRLREPLLDEMLRLAARRAFSDRLGSTAAITRLSEIVFIETLRAGIGQSPELMARINGFRDRQIGRALELIHLSPDKSWTVESLATEVAMSRSRFAERFRDLMGTGPMSYLSDWRLQKSLAMLERSQSNIQEIAGLAGYASPAAFTRAFAGKFGIAPSEYRRRAA